MYARGLIRIRQFVDGIVTGKIGLKHAPGHGTIEKELFYVNK